MADIRPFRAVRPKEGKAAEIAALPYDVYSRQEAKAEAADKPLSFLRIDRPEMNFDDSVDTYDPRCYAKAGELLNKMIEDGDFIEDDKACYYIYELTMNGRTQTGIVATASVDDYEKNIIKKHENTREDKELDRIRHVEACSAQTGPIFLGYRARKIINEALNVPLEYSTTLPLHLLGRTTYFPTILFIRSAVFCASSNVFGSSCVESVVLLGKFFST